MSKKINILCTPDNKYAPYCGIMLTSLFENNKSFNIEVYIMCETLNSKNLKDIDLLSKHYNTKIHIIQVNNNTFKDCPIRTGDHISIAAYYRLIAADVLPDKLEKILYLDCDMIVDSNIKELYDYDIENYAFGAIIDEDYLNGAKYERLKYDKSFSYINSGVILFNLEYWRKNRLAKKCLDYISEYPERIKFHDQDTLNAVLHKEMRLLPLKYNFQTGFLYKTRRLEQQFIDEIDESLHSPVIIHYTGANKPWYKDSKHPFTKRYMYFKNISLWSDTPLLKEKTSFKEKMQKLFAEIVWKLGIKKRPETYIIKSQN